MKRAEAAAASFAFAQERRMRTGLRKIPPPMLSIPDNSPNTAPSYDLIMISATRSILYLPDDSEENIRTVVRLSLADI